MYEKIYDSIDWDFAGQALFALACIGAFITILHYTI